ncbi:MAG: 50S ribosomal protein L31e [Candidatus Thorarchaeota archaeon]
MAKDKKKDAPISDDEPEIEEIDEDEIEEAKNVEVDKAPEAAPVEEVVEEEEIIDERIYTVPLRKAYWTGSRLKRANRSVRILREFVERHMKPEEVLIQPEVNEIIWARGIQKPPRRIRIRATKNDENLVRVYLAEG